MAYVSGPRKVTPLAEQESGGSAEIERRLSPTVVSGETLQQPPQHIDQAATVEKLPPVSRAFIDHLIRSDLLSTSSVEQFLATNAAQLEACRTVEDIGKVLIDGKLLTEYQFQRVRTGAVHGLVLGNYRVLDRIGAGGMGVVYGGEHRLMRRRVAIKIMHVDDDCPPPHIERFYSEMHVLGQLQHPNIVTAFDSGILTPAEPGLPVLLYLVMELVDGCDLERYADKQGVIAIGKACAWIRQAAAGLQVAHQHRLIHRDLKPSNLLLTKNNQIKLVDFGLVHQFSFRMTDPNAILGTVDFMPPEQSADPADVGPQADIYALGATLFWLLTRHTPYPPTRSIKEAMEQLGNSPPRRLRTFRPEAPPELERFIDRLLHRDPQRRPSTALSVYKFLEPFASL